MKKKIVFCSWLGFFHIGLMSPAVAFENFGSDASIAYLSMIFGMVDGTLHGTGTQIVGQLFGILSTVLFCFAAALWTYTTFVGVLNTAAQGQFLGQKWSSIWIPIRVILGFCLLIPKGVSGYSLIQIIVMSIVLKGVGAANLAWKTTLNYLQMGGTIVETMASPDHAATLNENLRHEREAHYALIEEAGKLLQAQIGMMTIYHSLSQKNYIVPNFSSELVNYCATQAMDNKAIPFPTVWSPGLCGSIRWESVGPSTLVNKTQRYDLRQVAVERMVVDLLPTAQRVAKQIISASEHAETSPSENMEAHIPKMSMGSQSFFQAQEKFILFKAVQSMIGILKVESRQKTIQQQQNYLQKFEQNKKNMESAGWLNAGIYYWKLTQMNKENNELQINWSHIRRAIDVTVGSTEGIKNSLPKTEQRDHFERCIQEMQTFIQEEKEQVNHYYQSFVFANTAKGNSTPDYVRDWLLDPFQSSNRFFQERMQHVLYQHKDPILALSSIGEELLESVEKTWKQIAEHKIQFPGMVAQYKEGDNWISVNRSLENVLGELIKFAALLPILVTWMLLNFTLGSILVYYVPLIPFLLFFFGALTWFGLVITAMVAAPLVAIGLMSPEGHEVFGQAEQATRLLASLFLRPLLMIVGLILGAIFCTVSFEFFHYGYRVIMGNLPQFNGVLSGISQIAMTTIYTTVAISIVTRSFALIYELPYKVFSWIGWQTEGHSEAEGLSQVKGGIDQYVGGVAQQVSGQAVRPSHMSPEVAEPQGGGYHATVFRDN